MKISELENAPQWLLDARTYNANVEIINSAVFWNGGDWFDGIWHGGVWNDGSWHDGIWNDGVWYGGVWNGGIRNGGVWRDGEILGNKSTIQPISIHGLRWLVIISGHMMRIGCQTHSLSTWAGFSDTEIEGMHQDALKFWNEHKVFLLSLAQERP